jgi:hypothetical protein
MCSLTSASKHHLERHSSKLNASKKAKTDTDWHGGDYSREPLETRDQLNYPLEKLRR